MSAKSASEHAETRKLACRRIRRYRALRISTPGFKIHGLGLRAWDLEVGIEGLAFRV